MSDKKPAVFIDFSEYPELHEALVRLARENTTSKASVARKIIKESPEVQKILRTGVTKQRNVRPV